MFGLMSNASGLKQRFGYTIILVYSLRGIRTEKYFFVAGKQEQIGMWVFDLFISCLKVVHIYLPKYLFFSCPVYYICRTNIEQI